MFSARIDGLANIEARIAKAVEFGELNKAQVQKSYRKIAMIYVRRAQSMVKDAKRTIYVRRRGSEVMVERGTLRRSMGTWTANKKFPTILAGPRANHPMKRKVAASADAWFAHIVEQGDFPDQFGGKSTGHPNYKVHQRAMEAVDATMRQKLIGELQKEFSRYMK
jgi:hypothetical protein